MFLANYDWPGNNHKLWRHTNPNKPWRMIFYDLGWAYNGADFDMFTHSTRNEENVEWPNPQSSTEIFRSLIESPHFRADLIDRFNVLLASTFNRSNTLNKVSEIKNSLSPEIPKHISRWNFPSSKQNWEFAIDNDIKRFLEERPCIFREQIIDFFELDDLEFDCEFDLSYGGLALGPNPNSGSFRLLNSGTGIISGKVLVLNLMGQVVYEDPILFLTPGSPSQIELNDISRGLYFVQAKDTYSSKTIKVLISD